ncbi:YHYH domain-containing protein [Brevifollis gellanilyticus]|uniref:YHYH domain-containing protein n=1 Tax=Brevifollis gellanilyticus TaxID=748831 RepID=UPI0011BF2482|nr:YHYH domain-containing protein [Brevifollis gellanilyticus]
MKRIILIIAIVTASVAGYAVGKSLLANHTHDAGHSGGLDQNGGHTDSRTGLYHYHR